jgi:hypothetical protein
VTPEELHALSLLAELQRLADPAQPDAVRITIRSATGEYLGETTIPALGLEHTTNAVSAVADYAERFPEDFNPTVIDPLLEADLEEYCIGLNVDKLIATARTDPQRAVADFDAITSDEGGVL